MQVRRKVFSRLSAAAVVGIAVVGLTQGAWAMTAQEIDSYIKGMFPVAGANDLKSSYSGNTVTITGTTEGGAVSGSNYLSLNINADVTVRWQASLIGGTNNTLVHLSGTGAFIMESGTIRNNSTGRAITNSAATTLFVTGGSVESGSGQAIHNASTGAVNISGGTVSAATGNAIYNAYTGVITISGSTTRITSANSNTLSKDMGTIVLLTSETAMTDRLVINGGTVENTSSGGTAIYNCSDGTIRVLGGRINAMGGDAIRIHGLGDGAANNGTLNITNGTIEVTGGIAIYHNGSIATISGGTVRATTGNAITTYGTTTISGSATITSANTSLSNGTIFVNAVGYNTSTLNITGGTVENTAEGTSGNVIYNGGLNTKTSTINVTGGLVQATNVNAIYHDFGGSNWTRSITINISGGTISTGGSGRTAVHNVYGAVNVTGGTILALNNGYAIYTENTVSALLGGNPTIAGRIYSFPQKLSVDTSVTGAFAPVPESKVFTLDFPPAEYVYARSAVLEGYNFFNNFELHNPNFVLYVAGRNLVIANAVTTSAVAITGVVEPIAGNTPSSFSSGTGNFTIGDVTWTLANGNPMPSGSFQANTAYTANITLTANSTFAFHKLTTATINGVAATITNNTGTSVTLSRTFAMLSGTVSITGTPRFGQTLMANTSSLTSTPGGTALGTLSYQWRRGGTNISGATGSTYTLVQADIEQTITVVVSAANVSGSVTSAPTAAVGKATQTAPATPTVASSTSTSITLTAITGAQYCNNANAANCVWQNSTTFSGLSPATSYTFYARFAETATHDTSSASTGRTASTLKGEQIAPDAPTAASVTLTSVTLNEIADAQYRRGTDGTWQTSTTFSGLTSGTSYMFYARLAETATHNASPASSALTVHTLIENAVTPTITAQPASGAVTPNSTHTLTVSATVSDGGTLSYQWYSNTSASNAGGTAIAGATNASYITPIIETFGNYYYYVIVTNTNNAAVNNKTAPVTSTVATVQCTPTVYTITYNPNNGANHPSNPANYTVESLDIELNPPTRNGYTFGGWYENSGFTGAAVTSIPTGSTGDKTYWAMWTPTAYIITYNLEGGTNHTSNPASYTITNAAITLQTPTRDNYTFDGWYDNSGFAGDAVTSILTGSTGDREYWALWTPISYTVSYNLKGGILDADSPTSYHIETETFALNNPNRTGYTFTGWTWSGQTAPQMTVTIEKGSIGSKHYDANWAVNVYTVVLDAAGGDVTPEVVTTDSTYSIYYWTLRTLPTPTRTGYTFNGWFTAEIGGTEVSYSTIFSNDATIYARWTPITYTIFYYLDSGTVTSANPASYNVETETFTLNNPIRTGYTFVGWQTINYDHGYGYYDGDAQITVTIEKGSTGNKNYVANWMPITYLITYNLAGGEHSSFHLTTFDITSASVYLYVPTKNGYTFDGWYDNAGLAGSAVTSIISGSMGDREYWAKWTPTNYLISYTLNGGTASPANPANYNIETETFTLNNPHRTGYAFTGWWGTSTTNLQITVVIEEGSTGYRNYTASWSPITYTITYNLAGINHTLNPASYTITSSTTTLQTPTRDGYTFGGWYDSPALTGNAVDSIPSGSTGDIELWAKWAPIMYTIMYDLSPNDGTVMNDNPANYDIETVTFTLNNPTRTGYTFTGWTWSGQTTPQITVEIEEGSIGNKNYSANWTPITYTITYNLDGGEHNSLNPAPATYSAAINVWLISYRAIKHGYEFGGWYDNPGLTGSAVESILFGSTGNREFWAKWTPTNYTLTYYLYNGAITDANPTNYNVETETFTLNNPTATGYTFTGWTWFDQTTPQTTVTIEKGSTGNIQFWANWVAVSYDIIYNLDGGENNGNNPATYNINYPDIRLHTPTKNGYTFDGWYDNVELLGNAVTSIPPESIGDREYWAKWTPIMYPISYELNGGLLAEANPTSYTIETETFTLNNPTRAGYTFTGWRDSYQSILQTTVTIEKGSTGYRGYGANWIPITYTITYNLNGGENQSSIPAMYDITSSNIWLSSWPKRDGYTFDGWYDNADLTGNAIASISTGSTGDRELWAKWTPIMYTISYYLDNGAVADDNPANYNIETGTFILNYPTRDGYIFVGWTGANGTVPQTAVVVERGSIGDRSYTANWDRTTSVLVPDRNIRPYDNSEDAAVVAPVNSLAAEFTAGPNVIRRSDGAVKIYRIGAAIGRPRSAGDNVLTVYDATGNVVNKISLSDNATVSLSSQASPYSARRVVGVWDLRDARGRSVSEGTYLLRGVVVTAGGKRERMSLKASVR